MESSAVSKRRGRRGGAFGPAVLGVCVFGLVSSCAMVGPAAAPRDEAEAGAQLEAETREFTVYVARSGDGARVIDLGGLPARDDVVMLYENELGTYPKIWEDKRTHGGTPVGLDFVAHLRKVREDVIRQIPDPMFDGLAVIDYEAREMLWAELSEPYRTIVREKVSEADPTLRGDDLEEACQKVYDHESKRFMRTTIGLCKQLRPRAKWGMYAFPRGGHDAESYGWLAEMLDVMMPSIYPVKYSVFGEASGKDQAPAERYELSVKNKMERSLALAGESKMVIPFVRTVYHDQLNATWGGKELNDTDRRTMMLRPEELGADGIVFWAHARTTQRAQAEERYLRAAKPLMLEAIRRRHDKNQNASEDG